MAMCRKSAFGTFIDADGGVDIGVDVDSDVGCDIGVRVTVGSGV